MIESLLLGSATHRWFCALAAVVAFACSGVSIHADPDSPGGASTTGGQSGQAGETAFGSGGSSENSTTSPAGSGGTSATGGASATGGTSAIPPCVAPSYSSDCSEVPNFQCGPSVTCDGTTFRMQWHEHVGCVQPNHTGLYDTIFYYSCTYSCAKTACESLGSWPASGSAVAQACGANH